MLVQLPGGSSDQPLPRSAQNCGSFEAGLRRDLASAPVVSYNAMLGGVGKRAIDLTIALVTLPVWLPILAAGAAWLRLSQGGRVVNAQERIGYGGRPFKCLSLHVEAPSPKVEPTRPPEGDGDPAAANDSSAIAEQSETRGAKWRSALERLPQMFNVIAGDMALVGPRPLSRAQLEPLRLARSYYLSARPGVVGVRAVAAEHQEEGQYKAYAIAWEVTTDVLILWDALRSLGEGGEPGFKLANVRTSAPPPAAAHRRSSAEAAQETL